MKNILKSGNVRVWAIGDQYVIEANIDATDAELRDAVLAEEELDKFRQMGAWN